MLLLTSLSTFLLTATAFFTSALSAATGMGGGVLLFTVMSLYFPIQLLIPIHGIIQFFNNLLTLSLLRSHLKKSLMIPFLIGSVPGILLAYFLLEKIIQTNVPHYVILSLILYSLFRPKHLPGLRLPDRAFILVGLITGLLGIIAGAIDPVLAPFFVRDDLSKEEIIANKSAMQAFVHLAKIPIFFSLGIDLVPYISFCLVTNIACFFGTKIGIVLLKKMSEKFFVQAFKISLSLTGLRLLIKVFY